MFPPLLTSLSRPFSRSRPRRFLAASVLILGCSLGDSALQGQEPVSSASSSANPDRTAIAIEALSRLENVDLAQNPKLKEAVLRVLNATRGTPDFVKLVKRFNLLHQAPGLLEVAINYPAENPGVEAIRLLLSQGELDPIRNTLHGTNLDQAVKTAQALGNCLDKQINPLLLPIVENSASPLLLRKRSVQALAQTREGASALLQLASENRLANDLAFTASSELNRLRWPDLKERAALLLPLPQGRDAQPLPPLAELLTQKGDPARGATVFLSPSTGCATCHQVKHTGAEIGPNLSEIGGKLGKDALYEAILDPSAGVSFGFEAWQLELASGEEAYGLLTSETASDIAIKDIAGIVTRYPKSQITSRTQMQLSIMPSGLQQTMSVQDLVDLVEYLASLKK